MYIRKVSFLAVFVSLFFIGTLFSFTWVREVVARPNFQERGIQSAQPESNSIISYIDIPAYDSGWESLGIRPDPISVEFTHNIGGNHDNYMVNLECRDNISLGTYDCTDHLFNVNVLWYDLTSTTLKVFAIGGSRPHDVRVRIFTETPAYDSGWESLGIRPDPISVEFTHDLGGNPDDYMVNLECRDNISLGVYDCTDHGFNINVHWYDLNNITVKVFAIGGTRPDDVRVRIYTETPTYDSGWESLGIRPDPISVNFTHNLGGNPDDYVVSLECWDNSSLGTYDCTDHSFNVNVLWYDLTSTTVKVFATSGSWPDNVRISIWRAHTVYLPILFKNFEIP